MCMTITLKQGDIVFVGKSIPVSAGKKKTSKGNIALALVSLVRFFWSDFGFIN